MNAPPEDHLARALEDERFRRRSQPVGADVWWHDDLGAPPEEAAGWLGMSDALRIRGEWETELYNEAKALGYILHIDMDGDAAERARESRRWTANLTPISGGGTAGILGDGLTPLGAGRDVLARAASRAG